MNNDWKAEMETRLAFQDQLIADLNDALVQQQKQFDELSVLCRYLLNRMRELESGDGGEDVADEKPPHY